MIKNKRAWIRIVEAFIAIMLITGVLLVVINKGYVGKADISGKVYEAQIAVLREIELDEELREDILNSNLGETPESVKAKITQRIPDYLTCTSNVCKLDDVCYGDGIPIDKDIYSQSIAIAANLKKYSPRQLKLFCWAE